MFFNERVNTQKMGLVRKFTDEANKLDFKDKVFLSIGVPDLPMIEHLAEGIKEAVEKGYTNYTPTSGLEVTRQSIASTYADRKVTYPIDKDNVLLTAGSQEAMFLLTLSTLGVGDEVIIISPAFFTFKRCSLMMGAKVIEVGYQYKYGEYGIAFEELEHKITERCKFIYINSPNNPTGIVTSEEELIRLTDIARKHGIYIVSDEVYKDYAYDEEVHSPIEYYDKVIIVDSISKTFSATGIRIGWLIGPEELFAKMIPMHQQIIFSTTSIGQYGLHYALEQADIKGIIDKRIELFRERRNYVYERLTEINGIRVSSGKGAFYLLCELDPSLNINGTDFCYKLLYEKGVVTTPGTDFGDGLDNCFRIAYTQDIEKLRIGIDRIEKFIKELRGEK